MKTLLNVSIPLSLVFVVAHSALAAPQIKLSGRKDVVLSIESRAVVLDVAREHLSEKDGAFLSGLESLESPFSFEQPVQAVVASNGGEVTQTTPDEVADIQYDDASVLKVVASSFAQQVRGTLARGSTSFLQLKGGSMVKPGSTFPASIPQAKGKTFTVTITEISDNGYTLQLGEASQTVSLDASMSSGEGAAVKLN